uniref:Uncharacterized protein n=1 Tax=Trichogramma kaykai TaxID=54128 RepID=A0ABD2WTV7_9HYME
MAPGDRKKRFDRNNSNNRQRGTRSNNGARSNDEEEGHHRRHAGPPAGGNSDDDFDDGSTINIRLVRGANADRELPLDQQPEDPQERLRRHMEVWYRSQVEDTSSNTPRFPPYNSWRDLDREDWKTLAILVGGFLFCIALACWWFWHHFYVRNRHE